MVNRREREEMFAKKSQYRDGRKKKSRHKSKKCAYCKMNMKSKIDDEGVATWECERCGPVITEDMIQAGKNLAKYYGEPWESLSPKHRHMRVMEAKANNIKGDSDVPKNE